MHHHRLVDRTFFLSYQPSRMPPPRPERHISNKVPLGKQILQTVDNERTGSIDRDRQHPKIPVATTQPPCTVSRTMALTGARLASGKPSDGIESDLRFVESADRSDLMPRKSCGHYGDPRSSGL